MVPIARRNLLAEQTRFAVAVGGVAFAVFLIILIQSLFMGYRQSAGAIIEEMPFELWVVQDGTFDLYHSTSILPSSYAEEIRGVPGVAHAERLLGRQILIELDDGKQEREFFLAFEGEAEGPAVAAGLPRDGPSRTASGPTLAAPAMGEVIVSTELARSAGINVGDTLSLGDIGLTVADTNDDGPSYRGFSYLNFDDARKLFGLPDSLNYVSVDLAAGADGSEVSARINEAVPGVDVLDRQEFADRSRSEIDVFTPVLAVVLSIGFIVGAAVISLTIYTATIEKARDFGVLKALGASRWYLYRIVTAQSFAIGFLGFATGVPLAIAVSRLIASIVPEFVTLFVPEAIIGVLAVVLLMCLISAILPTHRISRIDPAMVFRA
jgi:putative ABC transport system permease protein